jgi:NADPH:quinone reductase-like Zn-dependent oxidoreductase
VKAFVFDSYGGPDACHFETLPDPLPAEDELCVQVYASSVNPWDFELSWGKPWLNRLIAGGTRAPKKFNVLGCDVAGVVQSVGPKVAHFKPGDRIMADVSGAHWGGFAELALVKQNEAALIPDAMSMTDAASLPQAGVLALQGLRDYGAYQTAKTVLINGAGGGVGPIALQLACAQGAEVHAVDSIEKLDGLRALGATEVFDYRTTDFAVGPHLYDLILDTVQQRPGNHHRPALSSKGAYVTIGGKFRHILGVLVSGPVQPLLGSKRLRVLVHKPNGQDLEALARLWSDGAFHAVVARTYGFADVAEALNANGRGEGLGKLVIEMTKE